MSFRPASIDDHFKKRYHKYHTAFYRTEGTQYSGVYGDNPFEKFFLHDQPKIHSSNYKIVMMHEPDYINDFISSFVFV